MSDPTSEQDRPARSALARATASSEKEAKAQIGAGCAGALVLLALIGWGFTSCASNAGRAYKARVAEVGAERERKTEAVEAGEDYDAVHSDPERYVRLDPTYSNDFGSVMISGTLTNRSKFVIANVVLRCDEIGESRERLDTTRLKITKIVPAGGSVQFGPLYLTELDQQAVRVDCGPIDADARP